MGNFRFAIWGCGLIASYHAQAIQLIDGAELVGAYDINTKSQEFFCQKYGVKAFSSKQEMVQSDIDAICICLPSGLHYEAAMLCLENKKHIVIEKPIALNVKDANYIIAAADKNGVCACVVSQLRYSQSIKTVKEIIDSGKLGKITIGNAIMKYYRSPEYYSSSSWRGTWEMDGGGALMNQGVHGVDLLQYLMGKVTAVSGVAKTLLHDIQTEDTLTSVIEYENGAVGTIQATTSVFPGYGRKIEICGTKGSIVLCEDTIEICDVEGKEQYLAKINNDRKKFETGSRPDGMDCSLHKQQLSDFVECVRSGKKPWIDATEGKKSVEIICAIYESSKTGNKIYLDK